MSITLRDNYEMQIRRVFDPSNHKFSSCKDVAACAFDLFSSIFASYRDGDITKYDFYYLYDKLHAKVCSCYVTLANN